MIKEKLREYWHWPVIFLVVLLLVIFRLTAYGDPSLSIGTNDSSSYFDQVDVPTFSWEALTVRRLPSYVLFFKLFRPEGGYHLQAINFPADPGRGTSNKVLQPGFDKVVLSQMWLSILAWTFFAIIVARHLKNKWLKILIVGLILVFAFLPSVAEWDSIVMSESGTFSLFMLTLGFTIEVIAGVLREGPKISKATAGWGLAWLVVFLLWAFMRDSNANILIIPAALLQIYGYYGFAFFGDSAGLIRHLLGAVMPMRLMVWLFPVVLADFALQKSED